MRLPIIILCLLSFNLFAAAEDAAITDLLTKYGDVMEGGKKELVSDVFTKKFLDGAGGKEEFSKDLKKLDKRADLGKAMTWRKGHSSETWYAKFKTDPKSKAPASSTEFVIIKEDGKFKIDGTIESE